MATADTEQKFLLSESYVKARNDYFHRAIKWFYKDQTPFEVSEPEFRTPDFGFLVCLLQAVGFELHRIEMVAGGSPAKLGHVSIHEPHALCCVNITCEQSGLHAVLRAKSDSEATSTTNSGAAMKQENIPDTRTIASSLLPVVTPGTARVARDIISQLMSLFSGGEQTRRGAPGGCNSWTCPSTKQQPEIPQFQRRLSLDTFFPVDSSAKSPPSRPLSLHLPSDVMRMDTGDIVVTVAGSNEGLYSNPGSPLLGGNTPSIPQLVRQKTWSIGSIHELDDARASMSAPPRTSSPLQSQQQVVQNLEHLSLNNKGPAVVDRLREACAKIHEALSMLNSSKDNCMPEVSAPLPSKLNTKPVEAGPKILPSKPTKPTPSASASSSVLRPVQRTGTLKRQRSPAPRSPLFGKKDVVTPKPVKRSSAIFTPVGTPSVPKKTQDNEVRSGSFINMSDPTAGSLKLSLHPSNSAPGPQLRGNSSPTGESRRSSTSRKSSPSLPTSHSASNLASACLTPGLRGITTRKGSTNAPSMPSTPSTPNGLSTPTGTRVPSAPREGSKSVLRPSLLKAPSIINRFKK